MKVVYNFIRKALIFTAIAFIYIVICSLIESKGYNSMSGKYDTINKVDTSYHTNAIILNDSAIINISEVKEIVKENYINNHNIIDKSLKDGKIIIDKEELCSIIDSNYKVNVKLLNELEESQKTNINLKKELQEHKKADKNEKNSIKLNKKIDAFLFPLYIFIFTLILMAAFRLIFKRLSKWFKIK